MNPTDRNQQDSGAIEGNVAELETEAQQVHDDSARTPGNQSQNFKRQVELEETGRVSHDVVEALNRSYRERQIEHAGDTDEEADRAKAPQSKIS
jgi:hypothetical protein